MLRLGLSFTILPGGSKSPTAPGNRPGLENIEREKAEQEKKIKSKTNKKKKRRKSNPSGAVKSRPAKQKKSLP
jgi:hypothetical protein